ncbi:hypothetical protein CAOG_009820 [Capsaspora owczarzaki ATCC 30864]|uniref:Uncharacterized protein n=2 Tax=Capsaspora owczarzaki (strain ATCC 30864) TaxID=595528 RepID=A0A0D2X3K4_CAPO3|nr:hypothetical protein CAOG_009820 [Capsaspora owczarzaki ATCC 30864]
MKSLKTNLLGLPSGDHGSMKSVAIDDGRLLLTTKAKGNSFWATTLAAPNACFDGSKHDYIRLRVTAPAQARISLELQAKTKDCHTVTGSPASVALQQYSPSPFDGTEKIITIPLSAFSGVSLTRLHALVLTGFGPNPITILVDEIEFFKSAHCSNPTPSASPYATPTASSATPTASPPACSPVVVDDFSDNRAWTNSLGYLTNDDASMDLFKQSAGTLQLVGSVDGDSYWYSLLGGNQPKTCFDASRFSALQLDVKAPAGTNLVLVLQMRNAKCTTWSTQVSVPLQAYTTFNDAFQTVVVPFSSLPAGFNASRLHAVVLEVHSPVKGMITLDNVRFVCA